MGKALAILVVLSLATSACGGDEADSPGGGEPSGSGGSAGAAGAGGAIGSVPGTHTSSGPITVTTDGCTVGPCGGTLADTTWGYTTGCIDVSSVFAMCPQASYDITTTLSGSLAFTADQLTRDLHITATGTVNIPRICTLCAIDCAVVSDSWRLFWLGQNGTASCVDDGDCGCNCTLTGDYEDSETATYSIAGDTFTTVAEGVTRSFDYCADGSGLGYVETSGSQQPATYQLTLP